MHDVRDVQPAADDRPGAVADVVGGDGDAHVPVPVPVVGRQRLASDRDDRAPVSDPPSALERVVVALGATTCPGASWADATDTTDEADALGALRADAAGLADAVDPAALRCRLAVHIAALELVAGRFLARAETALREADRVALAAVAVRALGTAARVGALIAATAPGPEPADGDGVVPASARRPRIR